MFVSTIGCEELDYSHAISHSPSFLIALMHHHSGQCLVCSTGLLALRGGGVVITLVSWHSPMNALRELGGQGLCELDATSSHACSPQETAVTEMVHILPFSQTI
jgi:hypothetical protein